MLSSASFLLNAYWTQWITLFPSIPFWSPHGAVMTPIFAAALCVLAGKYCWRLLRRFLVVRF
jgi:hypothetical protein